MTHARTKLSVAAAVLAITVGYLAYAGIKAGQSYFLSVDTFVDDAQYHNQRVRLHGKVGSEGLSVSSKDLKATFILIGETRQIQIAYEGVVPDLFQAGGEVVVIGTMGQGGVFQAKELLTKCASKYEMEQMGEDNPV